MRSEITADLVEGQILTASGLTQWIQAEAEKTSRAFAVSPLLVFLSYLLGSVIGKIRKIGVDHFDPEHAGYAAGMLLELSEDIRVVVAKSDVIGLYDRFPSNRLFRKVHLQANELSELAAALNEIDARWQATVTDAAQRHIEMARQIAMSTAEEPVELFDQQDEQDDSPSEEAIRQQLHRTVSQQKK